MAVKVDSQIKLMKIHSAYLFRKICLGFQATYVSPEDESRG